MTSDWRGLVLLLAALPLAPLRAQELAVPAPTGRLVAFSLGGERVPVDTRIVLALPRWAQVIAQDDWNTTDLACREDGGQRVWSGRLGGAAGTCRYEQRLTADAGRVRLDLTVTADADTALEGVYFQVGFPVGEFADGRCVFGPGAKRPPAVVLPAVPAPRPQLLFGRADSFVVTDRAARRQLTVTLEAPRDLLLQDQRVWQDARYVVAVAMHPGALQRGQVARLTATCAWRGTPDTAPATVTLRPAEALGAFTGFGGNYTFNRESPVTQFNLTTLRSGWARVGINLAEWAPQQAPASPPAADQARPAAADRPGTALALDFELLREFQRRRIPCCVSVWRLPEWLYTEPGDGERNANRTQRRVADWDALIECVASYLEYAKRQHGVEPALFSFNEPDLGINVLFSAAEHRDLIVRLGARLARSGLATKLLLGDVAGAGAFDYLRPAASAPEARPYLGAVAFHSWRGRPEEFARWPAVARDLGLPLLVTELGVDPDAWRTPWVFGEYGYALDDLRMYQQVLLAARPQAVLYWEFTDNYPLAAWRAGRADPTARYWFAKHFGNLTPVPGEQFLATASAAAVVVTAFRGAGRASDCAVHLANFGAARWVTVTGLPAHVAVLWPVSTAADHAFRTGAALPVQAGAVRVELPAQGLLTLTSQRP